MLHQNREPSNITSKDIEPSWSIPSKLDPIFRCMSSDRDHNKTLMFQYSMTITTKICVFPQYSSHSQANLLLHLVDLNPNFDAHQHVVGFQRSWVDSSIIVALIHCNRVFLASHCSPIFIIFLGVSLKYSNTSRYQHQETLSRNILRHEQMGRRPHSNSHIDNISLDKHPTPHRSAPPIKIQLSTNRAAQSLKYAATLFNQPPIYPNNFGHGMQL